MPTTPAQIRRWFRFSLRTLVVVAVVAIVGCRPSQKGGEPVDYKEAFSDADSRAIVQNAYRVEAYRLRSMESVDQPESLASYPAMGAAVEVSPDVGERIAAELLDEKSYFRNAAKGCIPNYGVRIAFLHGDQRVDVLFCFECDILLVFRDEQYVGAGDFDYAHDALLAEVKQLFPDDEAIQSLK